MTEAAVFYGTIHPQGDGLSYQDPLRIDYPDGGYIQVLLHHGHFQALVSLPDIATDVGSFMNHLSDIVQGMIDALGFHLGLAVTVEIDGGYIAPDKAVLATRHLWPEAVGRSKTDPLWVDGAVLEPFTLAAINEPLARYAFADIRMALRQPNDTAFYAYRACESVRQWFQDVDPGTDDRGIGWQRLRESLGIHEAELRDLAELNRARRHGEAQAISEDERLSSIATARKVVGAFVRHLS